MSRTLKVVAAVIFAALSCWSTSSEAAFFGLPRVLKSHLERVKFELPVLEPMAHTRFCMQYSTDCETHGFDFRRRNIALTPERWAELSSVNREVNRAII